MVEPRGADGTGSALHVVGTGFAGGVASATIWGAGVGVALGGASTGGLAGAVNPPVMPTDLSAFKGLTFMAKRLDDERRGRADAGTRTTESLVLHLPGREPLLHRALQGGHRALPLPGRSTPSSSPSSPSPPYVMAPVPFDPTAVLTINFASNGPLPMFDYWIDDITFIK